MDADDDESFPRELSALLQAGDAAARDGAWTAFTRAYSDLILRAAHSFGRDRDARMDLYAHALEELARDDFRRLRSYSLRGAGRFSFWLALVVRRLCLDHLRHLYGRNPHSPAGDTAGADPHVRRRLVDLIGDEIDLRGIGDPSSRNPEIDLRSRELDEALAVALGSLAPPDLLLLKLRFEDELPAREVAQLLGFPTIFHVYRRQNALLGSLRSRLEARGVRDPRP